ncbi:NADH dehydrogenase subunit C [Cuniculiplasma divulgatum]|uniref:NADH dehydrogenase subunit C n=2 Tax=Cuniculiplasma divulgatum TaxID=1673428 RepID=A0A1N5WAK7_9ARCH|nr:NADH dehydrogenase subunit C [Cuniculiplasma divulgatum]SJK85492.1 NADH dehydrogenase subunit C [Cuniculiplasma divulgatum]
MNLMAYEVKEEKSKDGRKVLRIPKEDLLDLMKDMKNGGFDSLSLISTVDFRDRVEVVYHLTNSKTEEMLVIKSETRDSRMPSVTSLFESANWDEREQYDMMGIIFEGHPNLKRILLPEGWVGYPLRKDYDLSKIQYVNMDDEGNDQVSFDPGDGW